MGLRIKRATSYSSKFLMTFVALFALVVQPFYGVVANQVANAVSSSSVRLTAVQYNKNVNFAGIYFEFSVRDITNATGVELRVNRDSGEGPYSTFAKDTGSVVSNINTKSTNAGGYGTGGTVIVAGSHNSGSWAPQLGAWTGTSRPVSAEVVISTSSGEVRSNVVPVSSFVNNGTSGTYETVFANIPVITDVQAYYSVNTSENYTGIMVDTYANNIGNIESLEVRINDDDGDDSTYHSIFATPELIGKLAAAGRANGTSGTVIIHGERTSGSWTPQVGTWTGSSRPVDAQVIITLKNGVTLTKSSLIGNSFGTEAAAFANVPPAAPQNVVVYKGHASVNELAGDPVYINTQKIRVAWKPNPSSDIAYYWFGTKNNPQHKKVLPTQLDTNGDVYYDGNMTPGNNPYYYTVTAVNTAGVVSAPIQTSNILLDLKAPDAPVLKVNNSADSTVYTTEPSVTASWTQPEADVAKYDYMYWNSTDGDKHNGESKAWTTTVSGTSRTGALTQGEGTHYIKVRAIDHAGSVSPWSNAVKVVYDTAAPLMAISGAEVAGDTLSFTGSVSDANLRYYYCYLTTNQTVTVDGRTFTPGQEIRLNNNQDSSRNTACGTTWAAKGQTEFTWVLGGFNITGVPTGSYTINLVGHDLLGNNNAATPVQYAVDIDKTAPTGQVAIGGTSTTAVVTLGELSEAIKTPAGWTKVGSTYTREHTANGDYNVVIEDLAGNQRTIAYSVTTIEELLVTRQTLILPPISGQSRQLLSLFPIASPQQVEAAGITGDEEVLGAQTENLRSVLGDGDSSDILGVTATPTNGDGTWNMLGLAWYWWLLTVAAVAGFGWWLMAAIRRRQEEAADV